MNETVTATERAELVAELVAFANAARVQGGLLTAERYQRAADLIEADGKRIANLETTLLGVTW